MTSGLRRHFFWSIKAQVFMTGVELFYSVTIVLVLC